MADMSKNKVEEHGLVPQTNGDADIVDRDENSSFESVLVTLERKTIETGSHSPPSGSTQVEPRDTTSSYDDSTSTPSESPTGRLGGILESLSLSSRSRRPSTTSTSSTLSDPARWMPLLRPSETPVFTSPVLKAPRRAFPRQLLPLTGVGAKRGLITQGGKIRLLVLTRTRLLCMKERDGELVVKNEMLIGGQGGGIGVVTGVEKGDQTFVVQTVSSFIVKYLLWLIFLRYQSHTPTSRMTLFSLPGGRKKSERRCLRARHQIRSSDQISTNGRHINFVIGSFLFLTLGYSMVLHPHFLCIHAINVIVPVSYICRFNFIVHRPLPFLLIPVHCTRNPYSIVS